ncbi:MAG: amidohydrolase [Betaproteobacteria bacterium]|jgi:aminocarboxymuconate-semialdehyde decarboxylase|nr:amidohydrolase [Betaproteobacteria bacterium]
MKDLVIDIHAHFIPKRLYERFDANAGQFPGVRLLRDDKRVRVQFPGGDPTRPISPKLSDLAERRTWMDANGVDHQLVGGWLDSFGYELPPGEGLAWSRYYNDCMHEELQAEKRFTPLATVPLQDGKLAAEVLEEALDRGFGGAMIGTLPKGLSGNLDDPSLDPFWETASRLGAAIFMHPMFLCGEPRLSEYDLVNAVGRLADTTIAVSRLLFSGHLLRFPGMKFVLAHGGAALPYALGRLVRNHAISQGKYADPRKGFGAMYFDSCVFDADALEFLAKKAAPERIMLGSDMPFPIGDPAPTKVVQDAAFTDAQRKHILGDTAQGVFRVRPDCWCPR